MGGKKSWDKVYNHPLLKSDYKFLVRQCCPSSPFHPHLPSTPLLSAKGASRAQMRCKHSKEGKGHAGYTVLKDK